jgi:uncharacterized protein (TIGR03067 family)
MNPLYRSLWLLALGVLLLGGPGRADDAAAAKRELGRLEGTWEVISFEVQNEKLKLPDRKEQRQLTVRGEKVTLVIREQKIEMRWRVDPGKRPKALDIGYDNGDLKGQTGHAIYALDGDRLTVCIGNPGAKRPTEFRSAPGSDFAVIVYRRAAR